MDEWTWAWMYQSWLQDQEDQNKLYKDFAVFLGSFTNWEMAQKLSKEDDIASSDEDFEKSTENVKKISEIIEQRKAQSKDTNLHRRRRKVVN